MVHEDQSRERYLSELTDEQWAIVGPMIPVANRTHAEGVLGRSTCGKSLIYCST
jgi:hypothetical protein